MVENYAYTLFFQEKMDNFAVKLSKNLKFTLLQICFTVLPFPRSQVSGPMALANFKVILENALSSWIQSFHAFSDSEIAICWVVYEK